MLSIWDQMKAVLWCHEQEHRYHNYYYSRDFSLFVHLFYWCNKFTGPRTTWVNQWILVWSMLQVQDCLDRLVHLQFSALPLCHGCLHPVYKYNAYNKNRFLPLLSQVYLTDSHHKNSIFQEKKFLFTISCVKNTAYMFIYNSERFQWYYKPQKV